jgi:hypothetical protein
MNDKNKILAGLVVFMALFTLPFWFNMGKAAPAPELELTEKAKAAAKVCVMPTEYMKAEHMQLLDVWRHSVVRNAERAFVNPGRQAF